MGRTAAEILKCAAADFYQRYAENPESTEDQLVHNIANQLTRFRLIITSYYKEKRSIIHRDNSRGPVSDELNLLIIHMSMNRLAQVLLYSRP